MGLEGWLYLSTQAALPEDLGFISQHIYNHLCSLTSVTVGKWCTNM